ARKATVFRRRRHSARWTFSAARSSSDKPRTVGAPLTRSLSWAIVTPNAFSIEVGSTSCRRRRCPAVHMMTRAPRRRRRRTANPTGVQSTTGRGTSPRPVRGGRVHDGRRTRRERTLPWRRRIQMGISLDGVVALVTGAARGMGAEHVRGLVAAGAKVMATDVLDDEGRALADELGDAVAYRHLDVTSEQEWGEVVTMTEH